MYYVNRTKSFKFNASITGQTLLKITTIIIKYILEVSNPMREDITCVFEGVGSYGGIYISDLKAAENTQLLANLNIKAIVTAVRGRILTHTKQAVSDYLYVPADDIQSYDLSKHFEETFNFIDSARKKTNVLVHCYAGISRSVTIVVAYLIRKYNYSLQKVLSMIKRKRNKIHPNNGFIQQLKKEAARIGITHNQNQQPIEELLTKPSTLEKKKTTYSSLRIENTQSYSQPTNKDLSTSTSIKLSDGAHRQEENKIKVENTYPSTKSGRQEGELAQSTILVLGRSQKIQQKIQSLKSRVLEAEKKKFAKGHRRHGSEHNKNNGAEYLQARAANIPFIPFLNNH